MNITIRRLRSGCTASPARSLPGSALDGPHLRRALDKTKRIVEHRRPNAHRREPVNRTELCASTAARSSLSRTDAAAGINTVVSAVVDPLESGESVNIVGFGKIATSRRAAWQGYNPRTGETVPINARTVPEAGTYGAVRRCGDFANSPLVRTHAQSRAEIECLPRAHSSYSEMRNATYDTAAHGCARQEPDPLPRRLRGIAGQKSGHHVRASTTKSPTFRTNQPHGRGIPLAVVFILLRSKPRSVGPGFSGRHEFRPHSKRD